jgi:hypothetical protein
MQLPRAQQRAALYLGQVSLGHQLLGELVDHLVLALSEDSCAHPLLVTPSMTHCHVTFLMESDNILAIGSLLKLGQVISKMTAQWLRKCESEVENDS